MDLVIQVGEIFMEQVCIIVEVDEIYHHGEIKIAEIKIKIMDVKEQEQIRQDVLHEDQNDLIS